MRTLFHLDEIILAITLLLMISAVAIPLARKFGMGADLGLLLAGIIMGSSHLLGPTQVERLREVSELGVVFFLFLIGLELDLRKAWSLRRYAVVLGTLQVLVTGFVLMFYWRLFAPSWSLALLLGLVISSSSTALVLQMLAAKGELEQEHGRAAFGVLLFQDVAVVPIMVLIPVFAGTGSAESISWWDTGGAIGIMLILFGIGRWVCPWLLRLTLARNMTESFTAMIFIAILGSAWLASRAGLSMALGAFLMGLAFSGTAHRHGIEQEVTPFKNLLLALFFVSVGLSLDLTVLAGHTAKLLMHVLVIVVVKTVVLYAAARSLYMEHRQAVRLSFLLSQGGEFGFVILSTLLASGVVTPLQFASGTMVIALTMIATPLLDRIGITLSRRAAYRRLQ